jgi:flagellar motor switch protein FliG
VAPLHEPARPGLDEELLQQRDARQTQLAHQVNNLNLVLEDQILVDGKGIQRVLREIDTKDLAFSLKAASPEVAAHIKSNMSERAGAALDEEIELLGAVRIKDVNEAQERIVDAARQLEQDGEIVVKRGGSNDEFL